MRIGFDAKRAFCNMRGLGNYSRNTLAALTRFCNNDDFFLFTPSISSQFKGLSYPHATIIQPTTYISRALPSLWRSHGCLHDIKELNIDIYHGLSHELPFGIEKSNTRTVVTMHDLIFVTNPELYPIIDRKTYTLKYRHSCNIADKIVAISEQTKSNLINFWNIPEEKIAVVYQGCNPIFNEPISHEEKRLTLKKYNLPETYLLHVGAIERRKNQELILQAMNESGIDIPLVLVGNNGKYLQTLQKNFPDLFKNRVILLHGISDNELRAIYAGASIFIYPSLYEGFGIPILEAMSCGVPVITTDDGCFREAGGDACRYINPHNHLQLYEEISILLTDSTMRQECIKRGTAHLSQFSEKNISLKLSKIYNSFL